ncbi:MAG: DMT family transporter [Chloroflexi bacterium]|nr:DMT family transporter [Chloroflexota bacterium]
MSATAERATSAEDRAPARRTLAGVAFGLGAAVAYGTAQVLARHTVSDLAPPLVATFLALAWGTLGLFVLTARALPRNGYSRRGVLYFAGAGGCSAGGVLLMFQALGRGNVVIVSPLVSTNPLFTLVLATLLLRDIERITRRTVLGALLVVAGVVVVGVTG